ncbi:metal dependent amidohydrolase [Nemania serpens]|nr:metal dependent amidohydrolase [Nemania serpens]
MSPELSPIFLRLLPLLLFSIITSPQPASAECRLVKRGLSKDLLLLGTVLTDKGAQPDSAVLVHSGKIAYVGDICGLDPGKWRRGTDASVLNCTGSVISPGFINTHEHIDYATVRPLTDIGERVSHRHDWRVGARNATMREVAVNGSAAAARAWGELRHVFSGTTALVGGAMAPGLARNLDFADGLEEEEGLAGRPAARYDTFPLRDKHGIMRNGDCNYGPDPIDRATAAGYHRYIGHVGEDVDLEAANEFACLSNATFDVTPALGSGGGRGGLSTDIIGPNVALVHALGLTPRDFDVIAARGAKVVWSPRSNMYLYGKTLNASALLAAGITVALGTDWLPSGSATMGREAACAASVARESHGVEIAPKVLWEMATRNAAVVAGFEDVLGSLEAGKLADIVVFGEAASVSASRDEGRGVVDDDENDVVDPFAQAIFASQDKIELVLRGGKILLASSALRDLTSGTCETVAFGKSEKVACVADELGASFAAFEASLRGVYPAVLPDLPPDEPTCRVDG